MWGGQEGGSQLPGPQTSSLSSEVAQIFQTSILCKARGLKAEPVLSDPRGEFTSEAHFLGFMPRVPLLCGTWIAVCLHQAISPSGQR